MKLILTLVTTLLLSPLASLAVGDSAFIKGCTGFPCANFSVGAEVTPSGDLFPRILFNPPVLGTPKVGSWLEEWGGGQLAVEVAGTRYTANDLHDNKVLRSWPQASVQWADKSLPVRLRLEAWAPVVAKDVAGTALPVLVTAVNVDGPPGTTVTLIYTAKRQRAFAADSFAASGDAGGHLDASPDWGLGWDRLEAGDEAGFTRQDAHTVQGRLRVTLPSSGSRTVYLHQLFWHPECRAAADYADLPALFKGLQERLPALEKSTAAFAGVLPSSGDAKVDEYMRWYMTAAIMLTRVLKDDTTLTMGYAELNQRDSFWTSFTHLYFWPEAERRMLEESAAAVAPNGKVPTCIYPTIDRNDDLDINEYFLLRVARFYRENKDKALLEKIWPSSTRAMQYLVNRCVPPSALPEQESFWADWKDVKGVIGRKYGPHFTLLYLACLQEMAFLAGEIGQDDLAKTWEKTRAAADHQINLPVGQGGQWNGKYYVNIWHDGRQDDALLEDQMVAGGWGVISKERFESIRSALNARSEKPWGVRETVPYYDEKTFGLKGGDYHNGSVWPWLNCADALARLRYGHRDDALRILKKLGEWDLERFGDFLPHENLDGETGTNLRKYIQGWNAAYLEAGMALSRQH
jgi:hypothetical protein